MNMIRITIPKTQLPSFLTLLKHFTLIKALFLRYK